MDMKVILMAMGVSFLLAVIIGPLFIPLLRRLKFGQEIREDGPRASEEEGNANDGRHHHYGCAHAELP